jgi:glycosyltransferase involved in cell wall biosynthesis
MSQAKPTIALLIPAYNAAPWLPRLLQSAAAQTEPFDAIWTDDTAAVAAAYGAQVLRGAVNKGCSAGKNALAAHVEADFLHFHDADDELLPNFVSLARGWIERGAPDVVLFDYLYKDNETGALLGASRFDHETLAADPRRYAIRHQINPFCGLYRRSAYLAAGGYDEDPTVLYNEDVNFHIKLAFAGLTFGAEQTVSIINYRIDGSMSVANAARCDLAHHEVMQRTLARPDAAPYRDDIAAKLWAVAGRLAAHGEWGQADRAALTAAAITRPGPNAGSCLFGKVARISPRVALRMRERWIRLTHPELRSS